MKTIANLFVQKICALSCLCALTLALSSVSSTCFFVAYQPDVPEELN